MRKRPLQVTIIGDSSASADACDAAEKIGALLAKHNITVITGGRGGVMESACRGARKVGGITVGIVPSDSLDDANEWCSVVIPTDMGHGRNVLTALAADVVIALGGGAGTLSEIAFAWIHNKPILTLKGFEGWSDKLGGTSIDHRRSDTVIICRSIEELEKKISELSKSRQGSVSMR